MSTQTLHLQTLMCKKNNNTNSNSYTAELYAILQAQIEFLNTFKIMKFLHPL